MIEPATDAALDRGAALLAQGKVVAFPTETVYGLGADATSDMAVARIYAIKNRPVFNPLIVHVADAAQAETLVDLNPAARALITRFWPGPLTLVLTRRSKSPLSLLASAGLDTVAVRQPDHPVALALIGRAGRPVAAPSANLSGTISSTTALHVEQSLGNSVDLILDGGPCRVGIESTILDLSQEHPVILRPGGISAPQIEAILSKPVGIGTNEGPIKAPGMMSSHYAPSRPMRLDQVQAGPGEALLAFGPGHPTATLNLSVSGDLTEAAANLFAMMRDLDRPDFSAIAVTPIPEHGLGVAINDRLRRAAAPK